MSIIIIIAGLMISFSGYFVKESRLTLIEDAEAYGNGTDYFEQAGGIGESGYEDDDDIPMPSAAAACP